MVTQPDLARQIRNQYGGRLAILYDRILRHRKITANKSDTLWNINLNVPARSVKGILIVNYQGGIVRTTFELNKKESNSSKIQAMTTLNTSHF